MGVPSARSFTHSVLSQLLRRFNGDDLEAHYGEDEIVEVIHTSSIGVFMVTNLLTKHFEFESEAKKAALAFRQQTFSQRFASAGTIYTAFSEYLETHIFCRTRHCQHPWSQQ